MKKTVTAAVTSILLSGMAGTAVGEEAQQAPLAAENFSATIYLTNNYMFRGISNSDGPAVQGSLDWTYGGFFLGAWASNTEFSDQNVEIDYYGGYNWSWASIDWTVQGIYYSFPGEEAAVSQGYDPGIGVDADYFEVNLGAFHTFDGTLAPTIGVNYYYSPDTFGEDGDNHTVQGSVGVTLPADWGLYANVGYTDYAGDQSSGALGGYDYAYFSFGVTKTLLGFTLDLSYQGTDESQDLENVYVDAPMPGDKNFHDLIDGSVVFTISRSF